MQQPPQTRKSEHADPHEQYNPIPRVVLGLVFGLLVWAVAYIEASAGRSGPWPSIQELQKFVTGFAGAS